MIRPNPNELPFVPIVEFAERFFRLENGKLIKLLPHQKKILTLAFTPVWHYDELEDTWYGKLPYSTVIYSCPKKSGKTCINSLVAAWFAFCVCEPGDNVIIAANSSEHAQSRAYKGVRLAIQKDQDLRSECRDIGLWKITTNNDVEIVPISTDYGTASGANFSLVTMDEIWAYDTESDRRLFEELTPVPTRKNSVRFITTYAGFTQISDILEKLWERGKEGVLIDQDLGIWINEDAGIFMYWDEKGRFPWHTEKYYEEQRQTLRPMAFDRLHRNQWTAGEEGIDAGHWKSCLVLGQERGWTRGHAEEPSKSLYLAVGVDASIKKDRAAVVSVFKRDNLVWLGPRKFWQPTPDRPLDFEETIEAYLLQLQKQYMLGPVYFDPFQMFRSYHTLWRKGIDMREYTQTIPHGVEMCTNLTNLLGHRKLVLYSDPEMTNEAYSVALKQVVGRGFRITKDNPNKKIDSVVALAMACMAVEEVPSSDMSFHEALTILR